MPLHLHKDIDNLKKKILALSATVEESVLDALKSFRNRDNDLAVRVIVQDRDIDFREIEVEEDCLKILALHQPVAIDLRFIVSVLKINKDLERIGDLAVNIAERTGTLVSGSGVQIPADLQADLEEMAVRARSMLRRSLDALVNLNTEIARGVFADDDAVDDIKSNIFHQVRERLAAAPSDLDGLLLPLLISRHLERIADLATNISEDVVYMIEGRIIRHGVEGGGS
jgi:phosphate transport system protein